ncbi:MAG: hypothetical protein J7M08_10290 [Planctomycetes bacterium]|nr:hypothetical protein [Planctomycetota bacterium]
MIIEIYVKEGCKLCASAKRKIAHLLNKWQLSDEPKVVLQDTGTPDGAAESDFFDVFRIPTVLLKPEDDPDHVLARWDGKPPPSDELRRRLCA